MRILSVLVVGAIALGGCKNEGSLGAIATDPQLPPTDDTGYDPGERPLPEGEGEPGEEPEGPSPFRDTDGDGIPDDEDPDIDGDGVPNDQDPDPDGDGRPGYTLPLDPADDPPIDPTTGLPEMGVGSARGRVCAPNGSTWVAGAQVTILTPSGAYETTTNGDGWWQIDGLEPGTYAVVITKGSFELQYNITIEEGVVSEQIYDECLSQGDLRIAVVKGEWDHIEDVLIDLGLQVTLYEGNIYNPTGQEDANVIDLLSDPAEMALYDVVFLNCGISEQWVNTHAQQVATTLRDYVEAGGSIYASDWSYYAIEVAYPEMISFYGNDADTNLNDARVGLGGTVNGVVVDTTMATLIGGNQAEIAFDLDYWVVMDSHDPAVENLVEGPYDYQGGSRSGPLSVRFTSSGGGRVIYTSFHNEGAATTPDMTKMLQEIALSL